MLFTCAIEMPFLLATVSTLHLAPDQLTDQLSRGIMKDSDARVDDCSVMLGRVVESDHFEGATEAQSASHLLWHKASWLTCRFSLEG